jgi:hypothetical protein
MENSLKVFFFIAVIYNVLNKSEVTSIILTFYNHFYFTNLIKLIAIAIIREWL